MPTRIIHLINPKTDSLTTRPLYLNRALYSPLAGLLAVAASIPRDQYEVVLTDENIEMIDFDLKADLVGISAMTSYVNRGYEIADQFRAEGVPVVMGGVHPSFMPQEALKHCNAVVIGEVELVIDKLLDDLKQGSMRGTYKSDTLHPMVGMQRQEERGRLSFLCSCAIHPTRLTGAPDWLPNEIPQAGFRQTLASHGCRLQGSPGGR
jgi:radical SAM superfamily enzyme YgiQ (UPF0313 family)